MTDGRMMTYNERECEFTFANDLIEQIQFQVSKEQYKLDLRTLQRNTITYLYHSVYSYSIQSLANYTDNEPHLC